MIATLIFICIDFFHDDHCEFAKCRQIFASLELAKKHLRITGHHKMTLKALTKDETASQEDGVALSDVAPIIDISIFMKQPFTEIDFLDDERLN